jgi:DNA invertase Pin-like site-specific DNA recombinase
MPTRTIAYLRVSTEKQADRGVSLDAQRAKVAAYAELYDLELVGTIIDAGESAKSLDRPGLQRALGMLKDGAAEALLVVKLDRLTRSVVNLGTLVDRYFAPGKAALLSVGEQIDTRSAAGRLVLNVLASVSQWEREAIGGEQPRRCSTRPASASTPEGRPLTAAAWRPMVRDSRSMPTRRRPELWRASCAGRGCRYGVWPRSWSGEGCGAGLDEGSRRCR